MNDPSRMINGQEKGKPGMQVIQLNFMDGFAALLLIGGAVLLLVSVIQWINITFAVGSFWGLLCFVFPPAGAVFLIRHWREARGILLMAVLGVVVTAGGWDAAKHSTGRTRQVVLDIERKIGIDNLSSKIPGLRERFGKREADTLIKAVQRGDVTAVKALLIQGADINERSEITRTTVLMEAAAFGHAEVVKLLVESGADAALKNDEGKTALDFARENSRDDIVKILIAGPENIREEGEEKTASVTESRSAGEAAGSSGARSEGTGETLPPSP